MSLSAINPLLTAKERDKQQRGSPSYAYWRVFYVEMKRKTVIRKTDWLTVKQSSLCHIFQTSSDVLVFFLNPSHEPKGVSWHPLTFCSVKRYNNHQEWGSETQRAHNTQRFHESERSRAVVDKAPDPVTWVKAQIPFWSNVTFLSSTLLYCFHDALKEAQVGKGR